jgi:hypothetical protein
LVEPSLENFRPGERRWFRKEEPREELAFKS